MLSNLSLEQENTVLNPNSSYITTQMQKSQEIFYPLKKKKGLGLSVRSAYLAYLITRKNPKHFIDEVHVLSLLL